MQESGSHHELCPRCQRDAQVLDQPDYQVVYCPRCQSDLFQTTRYEPLFQIGQTLQVPNDAAGGESGTQKMIVESITLRALNHAPFFAVRLRGDRLPWRRQSDLAAGNGIEVPESAHDRTPWQPADERSTAALAARIRRRQLASAGRAADKKRKSS